MVTNNMAVHYSSSSNEWETPSEVFSQLNSHFNFDLDAAATHKNALCKNYFTQEDDALAQSWSTYNNVWCNPPYGREIGKFLKKGYEESSNVDVNGSRTNVVFLIPSRTDTRWRHDYCINGDIIFIRGRLKFVNRTSPSYRDDGNFKTFGAPFPSAIVIFGDGYGGKTTYKDVRLGLL